ncbi:MAG: YhcH/YjgK/YiaL family protein [Marinirhabdus sp.]|nr:YhcH/YjgK/YiaL family protein [Marinirhabdus sp.]
MVTDTLQNHRKYLSKAPLLAKAFQFLETTDLKNIPLGNHPIEGDSVFAIVMEYETKPEVSCIKEAHYRYIDVHYIISGQEKVGHAALDAQKPTEINKEKDYAFYDCAMDHFVLAENNFAIMHPDDIHQTGVQVSAPEKIKKVVVKVSVESTDE